MNVTSRVEGPVVVLEVAGDIDGKTAPAFLQQVQEHIKPDARLLLDLSGVGFMSSAGLRSFLLTHREVSAKQARLVLVGLNEQIRAVMDATGFLRFFTLQQSAAEGLAALQE